jgi:hypothetical protein
MSLRNKPRIKTPVVAPLVENEPQIEQDHCSCAPDEPFGVDYSNCCAQHDIDYDEQKMTRLEADQKFLRCTKAAGRNPWLANLYYYGVRAGGWFSWWRAGK